MASPRPEFDRILCPVDFSEFSSLALEHALRLARWFDARVEVLHVIPFLPFAMAAGGVPVPYSSEATHAMRESATQEIADLVAPLLSEGVPIETKLLEGSAWRLILDEARTWPADLLVMGTHGRSGFEHLLLGSVAEKVLRGATSPVLTIGRAMPHPGKGPLFRRILCAADLSRASERTLDVALSLATENDARITLLHVISSLPRDVDARGSLLNPDIAPPRLTVPDAARHFCDISERVETGTPWTEALRVAVEMDADLIVVGAHARGAVDRMLFGSTTSQIVRRATCPVLVVRETQKAGSSDEAGKAAGQLSMA
jgi:nucleotide-binding universal stress UspA family protein